MAPQTSGWLGLSPARLLSLVVHHACQRTVAKISGGVGERHGCRRKRQLHARRRYVRCDGSLGPPRAESWPLAGVASQTA